MQVATCNVLVEFVHDLGDEFIIDAINSNGVAFYHKDRQTLKFSIVLAPMFGVSEGQAGLVVTKNARPYHDSTHDFSNPHMFDVVKSRVNEWLDGL